MQKLYIFFVLEKHFAYFLKLFLLFQQIYISLRFLGNPIFSFRSSTVPARSDEGFKKYGATLNDERKSGVKDLDKYLNDVMEELTDAVLYIQTAREEIADNEKV